MTNFNGARYQRTQLLTGLVVALALMSLNLSSISAEPPPVLTILQPRDGAVVYGREAAVRFDVLNVEIGGKGLVHLHATLDHESIPLELYAGPFPSIERGVIPVRSASWSGSASIVLGGLEDGEHLLQLTLADGQHREIPSSGVPRIVTFFVDTIEEHLPPGTPLVRAQGGSEGAVTLTFGSPITIDSNSNDVGKFASLDLGSNDYARTAYFDDTSNSVKFIRCNNLSCSSRATTTPVSSFGLGWISLRVATDNSPRILHTRDLDNLRGSELFYLICATSTCSSVISNDDIVSSGSNIIGHGNGNSFVLDDNDEARIAYKYEVSDGDHRIRYSQCLDSTCGPKATTTIRGDASSTIQTSMAMGLDDFPRLTYFRNDVLHYVQCHTDNCVEPPMVDQDTELSLVGGGTGEGERWASIVVAPDGFARIAYYNAPGGTLGYVQCRSADCTMRTTTTIEDMDNPTADVGKFNAIGIGLDGLARISFYDETNGDLEFITCASEDCTVHSQQTLDTGGDVGRYTSLAVAANGRVHVAYYDATNGNLKYIASGSELGAPGITPTTLAIERSLSPGDIVLSWEASCGGGAEDYSIYEGLLGDWYSHTQLTCTDLGDVPGCLVVGGCVLREEITPGPEGHYYLVVPRNAIEEGSYGLGEDGDERPKASSGCVTAQSLEACP